MQIRRLLRVLAVVLLAGAHRGEARDAAGVVPALHDPKVECLHLQRLCRDARAAKQNAEEAMAKSRAFHERAKAVLTERSDEEQRGELQRDGHEIQARLTAMSRRRAEAAAVFSDAVSAVTAQRGVRPACGRCPGITE